MLSPWWIKKKVSVCPADADCQPIPELTKGDFVKVTGKLKADFYLSREGKPTGTLLIIAFEAAKIARPQALSVAEEG